MSDALEKRKREIDEFLASTSSRRKMPRDRIEAIYDSLTVNVMPEDETFERFGDYTYRFTRGFHNLRATLMAYHGPEEIQPWR